tara:strand:+ start:367 stop:534 length:168 start_codon:yes stop_codon:yes gene_type:complete
MKMKIYKHRGKNYDCFAQGFLSIIDGIVRILSLGFLYTNFEYQYIKVIIKRKYKS